MLLILLSTVYYLDEDKFLFATTIMAYYIVEFEDGLQVVPSEWLIENNKKCV